MWVKADAVTVFIEDDSDYFRFLDYCDDDYYVYLTKMTVFILFFFGFIMMMMILY